MDPQQDFALLGTAVRGSGSGIVGEQGGSVLLKTGSPDGASGKKMFFRGVSRKREFRVSDHGVTSSVRAGRTISDFLRLTVPFLSFWL